MFFVIKKIAKQSITVAYSRYRRYNYKCFTMMSDAKDFGKASKVQTKVVQSQQPQKLTEIQEKQKASTEILNNQKPNKMVGEDPNGDDSREDPKEYTNSNIESQKFVSTEIKKPSNIKKRRNRQKFNIGNPPKIEETKLESKKQNKKDDTKKQETQGDQKKQNKFEEFKKWTKWFFVGIGFGTPIGLYQLWLQLKAMKQDRQRFQKEQKREKQQREDFEKQMMEKYSSIQVQKDYIDSPMQDQIIECLNYYKKDRIKLIAGIPGIGKTSAIKKVLSDMKKSGVKVFYFSFGDIKKDKGQIPKLKKQFYALMLGIMKQYAQKPQYSGKKVKVVLDDINKLGDDKQIFTQIMKDLYLRINFDQIDINCVSSQSNFIMDQSQSPKWESYCSKFGQILLIQDHKDIERVRKFHAKVIQKKYGSQLKQIIKDGKQQGIVVAIANFGLTTREAEKFTHSFLTFLRKNYENISTEKALQILKTSKLSYQKGTAIKIMRSIDQIKENDKKIAFLSNFLSSEEQLSLFKCSDIVFQNKKNLKQFQTAIQKLQYQNTIIFCRARTRFQADIFRAVVEDLKKQSPLT